MTVGDQIVGRLRDFIAQGPFPLQSKLPPERDLAKQLGVTRTTLRGAMATLEANGEIWRHIGRGTFVGKGTGTGHYNVDIPADITNPSEVMEIRLILEPRVCSLAAHRASRADIKIMEQCLSKGEAARDLQTFEMWDSSLHMAIVDAAGNELLCALVKAIDSVRGHELWGRLKEQSVTPKRMQRYMEQHKSIVEAIKERDAHKAEQLMTIHLESVSDDMLRR
ncbi:MAG: FadR/GntR family transcriptional regulator [Alphaproteobacteria bacterium]|nr:FadR/GntR family transcriptional regulator [Alphaproteobacteria bacterium]